ncbi:hypothetical protein KVP08_003565 [Shewanella putrefaciens]|nr:hypothetical protein KVP08_003565 [Shewanella putrefaciens]
MMKREYLYEYEVKGLSRFSWFNSLRYRLTFFFGGISLIFSLGFTSYLSSITSDKLLNAYAK